MAQEMLCRETAANMKNAAILLCAGKGTRMGNATINKVAFACAGVPVVKRIVANMRKGGVERFVVVVGHRSESVMEALDGESGVFYAYQAEQKGTGHAAECGLNVLLETGFSGNVVVSMGDKIVSPRVISELLARQSSGKKAVLAVQPRPEGPTSRGHVVMKEGAAVGIVEAKDVRRALESGARIEVCGESFPAEEVAATKFVNAALYSFDSKALSEKLKTLRSDNAQGELYLTDTIESFAGEAALDTYVIDDAADMLTFSTRSELRDMALTFLRPISQFEPHSDSERELFAAFIDRFGDVPAIVSSSPGRINLMGRHIEHRGGSVNMMAVENRLVFAVSKRDDDIVNICNVNKSFSDASFRISDFISSPTEQPEPLATSVKWLDFLSSGKATADIAANRGHWVNYVKAAVLRFQLATDMPLYGMNIMASGNIPVAAGLSSSSAVVVATAEAVVALNSLNVTVQDFVDFCGEGEWYVGSRGGAGDHAAMKCSKKGFVTHLKFKPFEIGERVPFLKGCSVLVVNSGEKAKKSEGARTVFNSRISAYEKAFSDIRSAYPELPLSCFRDVAFLPGEDLEKALLAVREEAKGVALFGVKECLRSEECLELLKRGDCAALGEMMKVSHDGDRVGGGEYECSTPLIDSIVDRLNSLPGVYGSQIAGAGLGGCVIALVEEVRAHKCAEIMRAAGFDAFVCISGDGSRVRY